MARRVNTKFVILLSAALAATGGVYGTIRVTQWFRHRNPEIVKAQAEAFEKAGDLKHAAERYQRAADLLAAKHAPGADTLYLHAGDLCEKVAETADNADDAVSYYQIANAMWRYAMRENPRNKQLNEKLLDDQHENVQYFPNSAQYLELGRLAEAMIKLEDSPKAETYLAESKYQSLLLSVSNSTPESAFEEVNKLIAAALKLDPKYGPAVALEAQRDLQLVKIRFAHANVNMNEPPADDAPQDVKDAWKNAVDQYKNKNGIQGIVDRLNAYVQANGVQPDVVEALADVMQVQYDDMQTEAQVVQAKYEELQKKAESLKTSGASDASAAATRPVTVAISADKAHTTQTQIDDLLKKAATQNAEVTDLLAKVKSQRDGVIALLVKAYAADQNEETLALRLLSLYMRTNQREEGENLLKGIIASNKDKPEGYWRLAEFYRTYGETEKAIAQYENVKSHPAIGIGREALFNREYQVISLERLAWLTMDMAEKEDPATEKGKKWMKESADYTDKLRPLQHVPGILFMLDGRAQLLSGDTATAIVTLHKAEESLNQPAVIDRYRQTELLLAQANVIERQPGLALDLIDKALQIDGRDLGVILQRAKLLVQVGRFDEARTMMTRLLGDWDDQAKQYKNASKLGDKAVDAAQRILAAADMASGKTMNREALINGGAALALAQSELNDGDNEGAIADATSVLAGAADDSETSKQAASTAYQIAVLADIRQGKKDDAKKLAADALARFPKDATFQTFNAQLAQAGDANSPEAQKVIIDSISDDYIRQMTYAGFYVQQKKYDDALASLDKAETALGPNPDKDKQQDVIDRTFAVALNAATAEKPGAKRDGYFAQAQGCVTKAEKLNLDGTGGKLYQGRLEMIRTANKEGLKYLEQAVAQRPDYAIGRVLLGQAYLRVSNYGAALEQFREAARLAPNNLMALQYAIALLLDKSDSSSIAEAQNLLKTGLSLSPYNRTFVNYKDILAPNIDEAIATRQAIAKRDPTDVQNMLGLARLFIRRADQESLAMAADDHAKAVALIQPLFEKDPTNLKLADTLAHLQLSQAKGVTDDNDRKARLDAGQKLYDAFIANPDVKVQFAALILKAQYARDAGNADVADDAFHAAIKIEPDGSDLGERYLADMYFDQSRWADADALYSKIVEKTSDTSDKIDVVRRLIETLLRENTAAKRAAAAPLLANLLKQHPDDKQGLILKAFSDIQEGNYATATTSLNKVLAADDGNIEALYYRANASLAQGHFDDAIRDLTNAQSHDPTAKNINVRMLLAQLYQQTLRYGEASLEYADTISLHPDLINIRIDYTSFLLDLAQKQKKLPPNSDIEPAPTIRNLSPQDRLYDQIKDASVKFPAAAPRWFLLYAQLLDLRGTPELAHNIYKKLADDEGSKHDANIQDAYIGSMLTMKDYAGAITTASGLLDNNESFIAQNPQFITLYLKRAKAFFALGKEAEGLQDVNRALSVAADVVKKKNDVSIYLLALRDAVDTDAAAPLTNDIMVTALRARIAADPTETMAKLGLVQILTVNNQMADALKVIQGVELPTDNPVIRSLALRQRALVESQNKLYPAAEADFQELLKANPYDIESLNNYAFMLSDNMNDPKRGIEYAQRALDALNTRSNVGQVFSEGPVIKDTLGWSQFLKGDVQQAISTLRDVVKLQPIPSAYYHLATAYEKSGDVRVALQAAQDGLKLAQAAHDSVLPDLQKLQEKLSKMLAESR